MSNHVKKTVLLISTAVAKYTLQPWAHKLADIYEGLRMMENTFRVQIGVYVFKTVFNEPLKEKTYNSSLGIALKGGTH